MKSAKIEAASAQAQKRVRGASSRDRRIARGGDGRRNGPVDAAARPAPACVSHQDSARTQRARLRDLAAVVTVTDDGGSSGRLRQDFNMLPPGDLRNCMVALSEEEDLLSRLFTHRFKTGKALKGHNFGNLFVAALTEITGDFAQAVQLASKVLATRGRIYPATTANATLVAKMEDGIGGARRDEDHGEQGANR